MKEDQSLIVGLDLCDDTTQLSVFNYKTFEVDSIYEDEDGENCLIPTALAYMKDSGEWFYGTAALDATRKKEGILLHDFIVNQKESQVVYGTVVTREQILQRFIRKTLLLLKREYPNKSIRMLVVTLQSKEQSLIDELYDIFASLGIYKERLKIVNHAYCYMKYALSQKRELWTNDVALFDFNDEGLFYYQISVDRRNTPMRAMLSKRDFSERFRVEYASQQGANLGYIFENICKEVVHKQIISTIYLTGKGFLGDWLQPSLQELCVGRRLFVGQNLYCYGACYVARELGEGKENEILFFTDDTISTSVLMPVYTDGEVKEVTLVEAGIPWYEVEASYSIILDEETEIPIILKNLVNKETDSHMIALTGIDEWKPRTNKLELRLQCVNPHTLVVTVKDVGFGTVTPSTNRVWEQIFTI